MITGQYPFGRSSAMLCLLLLAILFPCLTRAEGSKELTSNGGNRAFLFSGSVATASVSFPTLGTTKVYAKAGESINVGSSVQGFGAGTINLRAPNGTTFTSGASTTVGLIANRGQEVAGPLPNAGGYTPYTHTVTAAEEGVWEVDFISQNNGIASGNPFPLAAGADWVQGPGQYIDAFDITVRNAANTAFLIGRVYTNIFSGILGTFDVGFNGIFQVLTKDGYKYSLDNNGQAGNGFSFFVNNKGFRKADGTASYKSVNSVVTPNIQDPRAADTQTDITYKIFFNIPAADLPATANTPGGTTWLLNPVAEPTLSGFTFTGTEGTAYKAGTAPLGATLAFTANKNGTYAISIDVNKNGVFTDAIDRKLTGTSVAGTNNVTWDGLDGQGNKVPAGSYTTNLNIVLFGGEVHFPFFDVERNVYGLKLTRTNGFQSPDYTLYWDDSNITSPNSTPSNPLVNLAGISSQTNGHKWGTPGADNSDFGNEKGLDTWAYIAAAPLVASLNFEVREADLEVLPVTNSPLSGSCAGQQVNYTIIVKNNGPSAITAGKVTISIPANYQNAIITSVSTTGASAVNAETKTGTLYTAGIDIANGATRTFTMTGLVPASFGGGAVQVNATVTRPADVTDPDATNPDAAPPVEANVECNSVPSGPGCNNIKSNTLTFVALPSAGDDQTIVVDDVVTLTDQNTGVWNQATNLPVPVTINSPFATSTNVTSTLR